MVRSLNEKAKELFDQGVQLVMGDLNDVDSLVHAMDGCYGVFGVTNYWDPTVQYDGEIQQGKNLGDACKRAGIQHLVFSTLDRNSNVPHFESKVIGEDYMKAQVPTTSLVTSFYFENLTGMMGPREQNGEWVYSVPLKSTTKVPMFSVYETGGWALQAFLHPELYLNQDLPCVSHYLSMPEVVETLVKVTGKKFKFHELTKEVFKSFGFPGVEDLCANMEYFDDLTDGVKVDRRGGIEKSRAIFEGESWDAFLNRTKWMQ